MWFDHEIEEIIENKDINIYVIFNIKRLKRKKK